MAHKLITECPHIPGQLRKCREHKPHPRNQRECWHLRMGMFCDNLSIQAAMTAGEEEARYDFYHITGRCMA